MHRKASFYITKRALAKVVVGMERVVTGSPPYIVTSYPSPRHKLQVWAINGFVTALSAVLSLSAFDIESGKAIELPEEERKRKVSLGPNQTTELVLGMEIPSAETTVVVAYLEDETTGERLARWVDWPQPLKFVHFRKDVKVEVAISQQAGDVQTVTLSADAPVKGVMLSVPISAGGTDAVWDDNFIDLVPGEEVPVGVTGLAGRKVETRWLADWEAEEGFSL